MGLEFSFRRWAGAVFLLVGLIAEGSSCVAERIPEVHGTSLSNQSVNLPEALSGKVGVLVLGFSRSSRDAVASWGRRLATDYRESPTVAYYEMPVLASGSRYGAWIHCAVDEVVVPEQMQARFVPIMDNEAAWRGLVHYGAPDDPYVWWSMGRATWCGRRRGN